MSSSSGRRSSGRAAVFLGVLALLAIPAAVAVAQYLENVPLLRGLYVGVPAAFVLGLVALAASRRARFAAARRVEPGGGGTLRLGHILAWAGLYAGITGGIALGVYWALRLAE